MPEVADYKAITSGDGSTSVVIGSWSNKGARWTPAGRMCTAYPKDFTACGPVFRNPSGTFEGENKYLQVSHGRRIEFSVVK